MNKFVYDGHHPSRNDHYIFFKLLQAYIQVAVRRHHNGGLPPFLK